jgi:DNA-binding Xre family transcriptional regulator
MSKAMARTAKRRVAARTTYLLNRAAGRSKTFTLLKPEVVSSVARLRQSLERPAKNSLWISYDQALTEALLKNVSWRDTPLGEAVLVHSMAPESLPALRSCFAHFAFSVDGSFLSPEELAKVLHDDNRSNLFIGGSVDHSTKTITLWRGNLESLTVPFSAFAQSGDGIRPEFMKFSVTDYGQTIRLGKYEAAADAVLYEFDADYRRRMRKLRQESDQTFGASLRRLRKQRGLRREDFGPEITAKTVARIEQGKVTRIQQKTLVALAARLEVSPEELGTF